MSTIPRVLVLQERGGHHIDFSRRARTWLNSFGARYELDFDYIEDTNAVDEVFLARYAMILQLDFPPYGWSEVAAAAFERYVDEGRGGWVGLHHASLLGEFDGYTMWQWFSKLLGDIRYQNYIASFAQAEVNVEDGEHPVMRHVPASFVVGNEEWYTYNRSPRPNVHVLASVDESTYVPDSDVKMGDHPVVWTNGEVAARNVYIFMGHSPELFDNAAYVTLMGNSILWAVGRP